MSDLSREEFDLLVSQVIIPNHWHGARPLTEREVRKVGNNASWINALQEVSQVTRDNYLEHIRTWWHIRDHNNAKRITRCPEDNGTRACPPALDGALCDYHQEWVEEEKTA